MKNFELKFKNRVMAFSMTMLGLIALTVMVFAPEAGIMFGAAIAVIPIWGSIELKTFKELTGSQVSELSAEDQIKYFNELNQYKGEKAREMESNLKKEFSNKLEKELNTLKAEIVNDNKEQMKSLQKAMEIQGLALNKLMSKQNGKDAPKTIKQTFEGLKDKLKELRNGAITSLKATVLGSDIGSDNVGSVIPGAGRMQDRAPFLRDLFSSSGVGGNSHSQVFYTDQTTNTAAAAAFEEGSAIPSTSDIVWTSYSLDMENVGDSIKIAQRMIDNVDFVAGEVRNFLTKNINLKVDAYLYSGTGSNQPYGVTARATAYAAGSYATSYSDANLMDLIRVCKTLVATGTMFNANYAILNPIDAEKYLYGKKDANNNYIIPQNGSLISLVGGLTIVVNSGVTVDTMVVGDFTMGVVYNQKTLNLEFGFVDDDFQKNLVTLKGYEELNLLIRSVNQGAFRYVSGIAAAISGLDSGA